MTEIDNLGSLLHQAINPEEVLCLIEFSDGSATNDYIPTEVLNDPSINATDWWTQEAGPDYRSIVDDKKKAVSVTAIKNN